MNARALEADIASKAVAPRVTLEELEANIVHVDINKMVTHGGGILRWAVLTTKNGFAVTGEPSAAVSPANDRPDLGEKIAIDNAKQKLWALMGYELRSKVALIEAVPVPVGSILQHGVNVSAVKTYVGTKVVHAVPMTRIDYNVLRGWQVPADEAPFDDGYLVEYTDGGTPNVPGYAGYISWSPKDVFERAYSVGANPRVETFLDRLKAEFVHESDKLEKLGKFLNTPAFQTLSQEDQRDLKEQQQAMRDFVWVLNRRLKRLS